MKVDLERLRRSLARYVHAEENAVPVATGDLEALLAVVGAAREYVADVHTVGFDRLVAALEPFTPPPAPRPAGVKVTNVGAHVKDMAPDQERKHVWALHKALDGARREGSGFVSVSVWALEALLGLVDKPPADRAWEEVDRWNARDAKPNTFGNPRDRARDQLADAGVAVQRQFRSDQERIAELERELEAERTRGIDHAVYEMVCEERDTLEARLARVPALVEAIREAQSIIVSFQPMATKRTNHIAQILHHALLAWGDYEAKP